MAVTPEGRVKKLVNDVLDEFSEVVHVPGRYDAEKDEAPAYAVHTLYRFWPVPSGFGKSSLDCIVTYYGVSIFIETKAPGKRPTPRQELMIAQIKAAGGLVFVIDDAVGCQELRSALNLIRLSHANSDNR